MASSFSGTGRIWVNGELFSPAEARVPVMGHGYLYGDGVFETLRTYGGIPFRLEAHLDRLKIALATIRIDAAPSPEELAASFAVTLKAAGLAESYCRITVSRGVGEGLDPRTCGPPTVVIAVLPLSAYPDAAYTSGITGTFLWPRARGDMPPPSVKTTSYQRTVLARLTLADRGAGEGFFLDEEGNATEGTVSNLFMVKGGSLVTPHEDVCLAGITRAEVLAIARTSGIIVEEGTISRKAISEADEVFVTSSLAELLPVTRIDERRVGSGAPGPMHAALLTEYRARTSAFAAGRR
ncbi:MAG: aminotransferase class IV [Polyangiaceae bacterium]